MSVTDLDIDAEQTELRRSKATRYLPKHAWYLPDAQLLVRELQAKLWPVGWHVALGGGVLNHGYSDKDVDLYVLPIYREGQPPNVDDATRAVFEVLDAPTTGLLPSSLMGKPIHECYASATEHIYRSGPGRRRVDVFVMEPFVSSVNAPDRLQDTLGGMDDHS